MQIVGIDFGTTNVRVSIWDSEQPGAPVPQPIGQTNAPYMPAVIALQRQETGEVSFIFGEIAELSADSDTLLVIPNIKRFALSSDEYVYSQLAGKQDWESEIERVGWNAETRSFEVFGQQFYVGDLIARIISEALRRANIRGEFQWRAGCPVHAGIDYRRDLMAALPPTNGQANLSWVIEEPTLLLTLAWRLGNLREGSYLVYDLGGGSFDSVLAEVNESSGLSSDLLIYAADGNPVLGGSNLDPKLKELLSYDGPAHFLRIAKDNVGPDQPQPLPGSTQELTYEILRQAMDELKFDRFTAMLLADCYVRAKDMFWKWETRQDNEAPRGNSAAQANPFDELRGNVIDRIIAYGGPINNPLFIRSLEGRFGDEKVISIWDIVPAIPNIELTAISMGACYAAAMAGDALTARYVNRIPAEITLADLRTGNSVGYQPYQLLSPTTKRQHPTKPGEEVPHLSPAYLPYKAWKSQPLTEGMEAHPEYRVTIAHPDGRIWEGLQDAEGNDAQNPHLVQGYRSEGAQSFEDAERIEPKDSVFRTIADTRYLEIDHFHRIMVTKETRLPGSRHRVAPIDVKLTHLVNGNPPWQLPIQRDVIQTKIFEQRLIEQRNRERQEPTGGGGIPPTDPYDGRGRRA